MDHGFKNPSPKKCEQLVDYASFYEPDFNLKYMLGAQ